MLLDVMMSCEGQICIRNILDHLKSLWHMCHCGLLQVNKFFFIAISVRSCLLFKLYHVLLIIGLDEILDSSTREHRLILLKENVSCFYHNWLSALTVLFSFKEVILNFMIHYWRPWWNVLAASLYWLAHSVCLHY